MAKPDRDKTIWRLFLAQHVAFSAEANLYAVGKSEALLRGAESEELLMGLGSPGMLTRLLTVRPFCMMASRHIDCSGTC
jgi:hypothetical protein